MADESEREKVYQIGLQICDGELEVMTARSDSATITLRAYRELSQKGIDTSLYLVKDGRRNPFYEADLERRAIDEGTARRRGETLKKLDCCLSGAVKSVGLSGNSTGRIINHVASAMEAGNEPGAIIETILKYRDSDD
ncbi:MAG: hypothetical protein KJ879_01525 [Nanoarchaeota archaeon]|nr:hypothetical protein [Nanoarchaeota archaeon]